MSSSPATSTSPQPQPAERRRTRRVQVRGLLHGQVVSAATAMDVQDLSFGGFSAVTATPFFAGMTHEFEFSTPQGPPVVLTARVAHCRRLSGANEAPRFYSGFEFAHRHANSRRSVNELIAQIAAVLRSA